MVILVPPSDQPTVILVPPSDRPTVILVSHTPLLFVSLQLLRSSQGQEVDHTGGGYGVVKKSSELQEYRYTTPTKKT